jgi:phosphate:Na+ symporter
MVFKLYSLAWWSYLCGGLSLFLFSINLFGNGLKKLAGDKLKPLIDKYTSNPLKAFLVGLIITMLIQSSSGVTAIAIGLISVGMMSFKQGVGIILGANIGTTVTSLLISLPLSNYSPFIFFVGVILYIYSTKSKNKYLDEVLIGCGGLFMGLDFIDTTLNVLASDSNFIDLITSFNTNPLVSLLVGTLGAASIQSSSAFIGIIQSIYEATKENNVTLIAVLPLIFGANIGTTITGLITAIGYNAASQKTAMFHVLFNLFGALIFMILLKPYATLITLLTTYWNLAPKTEIALAHILFNIFSTILIFPFLDPFINLINKLYAHSEQKLNSSPLL